MKQIQVVKDLANKTPSIFKKMFFSFLIVPIIPIVALVFITDQAQKEEEAFAESNLINAGQLIGANINSWVDRNIYVSNLVSQFSEITSMDPEQQRPILRRVKENSNAITAVRIDDSEGMAIARSDDKSLKNYSDRIYFQQVKSGLPVGQQVIIGKTQKKPLICFTVPVNNQGAFKGALSQCAALDDVSNNVTDLSIGETGFAFLVDGTNKLIAYGGKDKELSGQLEDMSQHPAINSGSLNQLFTYDIENKKIAYKSKVGLNWTLVVQQDYQEAYAIPIAALRNAIIAVIVTLLACVIVIFLMSRVISRPLDEARQENADILSSVNDGLFLIDETYTIGKQQSSNLSFILQKEELAGTSFMRYLSDAVPIDVAEMAKDYIDLLFQERIKEGLVQTRNPLKLVQTSVENPDGQLETKYLSLTFKRVYSGKRINNLLVTAKDITQETLLKAELEKIKEEKNQQVNLLAEILYIPVEKMRNFLADADASLNKINDILELPGSDHRTYQKKVREIYNIIHTIKGNAGVINFELFAEECHDFEEMLNKLRIKSNGLTGNDFLPVTLALEELFKNSHVVHVLLDKIGSFGTSMDRTEEEGLAVAEEPAVENDLGDWRQLKAMAERLADKYEKEVEVHFQGFKLDLPDDYRSTFKDIATQLIRNSLTHGIETVEERVRAYKVKEGQITLSIKQSGNGYALIYKDDGQGIDYEAIRQKLVDEGRISRAESASIDEKHLLQYTFREGFSMAAEANLDAGRGVGMPVILDKVKSMRGKINAASKPGKGFIVKVTVPEQKSNVVGLAGAAS